MDFRDDEGRKVKVFDLIAKRWLKGIILHVERLDDNNEPNGWSVELRNGNRGNYDSDHLRFVD